MKHRVSHSVKHSCTRRLNPLSMGLFFTACLLFAFSFMFYFLSLLPI